MDEQLVARAQSGDHAAFGLLVAGIADRMHAVAQGILRDRLLAEDATQQALVEIWLSLPRLQAADRFEAWAYRILVRTCRHQARRAPRWLPANEATDHADHHAGEAFLGVIHRDQLERAFRRLSIDHRTVVILCLYADHPVPQVAATLGIPEATVRSRLYHATRALRASLEADARTAASHRERSSPREHEVTV